MSVRRKSACPHRARSVAVLSFLTVLLLSGCTTARPVGGGKPVTSERLAAVSADVFAPETVYDLSDPIPLAEGQVCWTAGGSVYHVYADCRYLKNVRSLYTGTSEQAVREGKEKLCSACEKRRWEGKESHDAESQARQPEE